MRWSLVIFTLITVLSTSLALVTTPDLIGLERRARQAALSSKAYRASAARSRHQITFDTRTGDVAVKELKTSKERDAYGSQMSKTPKTDADHIFECQVFDTVLERNNVKFSNLPKELQDEAIKVINSEPNMAFISASVNRSKGVLFKQALRGVALRRANPSRDLYIRLTYPIAKATADRLDRLFKAHNIKIGDKPFFKALHDAMIAAKI